MGYHQAYQYAHIGVHMGKHFPMLMKNTNLHMQEAQQKVEKIQRAVFLSEFSRKAELIGFVSLFQSELL